VRLFFTPVGLEERYGTRHARDRWTNGIIAHFIGTMMQVFDFPSESGQTGSGERANMEVKERRGES
jgi:hypothetical protein